MVFEITVRFEPSIDQQGLLISFALQSLVVSKVCGGYGVLSRPSVGSLYAVDEAL